ncbi:MAG TPA: hypothetical protein VF397_05395 [Pyrinomonadaceae bacterium]
MANLDVLAILSYGITGFGFLLAALTYYLLHKEQSTEKPRKQVLQAINRYMIFSLALVVFGIAGKLVETKRPDPEMLTILRSPVAESMRSELDAIAEGGLYRKNFKWSLSISELVLEQCPRLKFKLSVDFWLWNLSNKALPYSLKPEFEVAKEFEKFKLLGKLLVQSSGETDDRRDFWFSRQKGTVVFSCDGVGLSLKPGESKFIHWETADDIEVDYPFHDYLTSVEPTDTVEISVDVGKTGIIPVVYILRTNQKNLPSGPITITPNAAGHSDYTVPGPFLPYQGFEIILDVPKHEEITTEPFR